jgi:hypothetical protein
MGLKEEMRGEKGRKRKEGSEETGGGGSVDGIVRQPLSCPVVAGLSILVVPPPCVVGLWEESRETKRRKKSSPKEAARPPPPECENRRLEVPDRNKLFLYLQNARDREWIGR